MELATSQLLFLLAIGVFAALGYAAYRYFAKPSINILDQLKEQVCVCLVWKFQHSFLLLFMRAPPLTCLSSRF